MNSHPPSFVTVVSGLPRSGTSMMMQMLAAGGMSVLTDEVRGADDDNTRGYLEFEPVKRTRQDASWLETAAGKAVKMVYMLLADLPVSHQYRVVFMQRALEEVLASQQVMLQRRGEKGADLPANKMADIFRRQLDDTRAWLARQSNFDVLHVDYRAVIDDPLTQARRVAEFLDAQLDVEAMARSVDPQLYRQRQNPR